MENGETHFEQVSVTVAKKIAEQESLSQNDGGKKRTWDDIAAELVIEQDPTKLVTLVQELNAALETRAQRNSAAEK